ncbi:MAG: alpha/beta hydrolase [Deltaproteobacteria bacterium]|nr:alpha/beta hydrolase [Deltaproteobacteria bacterium]
MKPEPSAPIAVDIALPRPRARLADTLRVVGASMGALLRALLRRAAGRRAHPRWPLRLELVVAATRGSWSLMPKIGMVRWRNVGEALSPLATDGLEPRFEAIDPMSGEDPPLYGAWLEPPDAEDRVLLYFHGGGFAFGSLRTHGEMIGALARAARARTFSLEYRLAPESPAPAAVADARRAYRHLLARGIDPGRIALAGDSAGGTLVLDTLRALREAGDPLPGAAVAISPWVDLACSGDSFRSNEPYDFVGREHCLLAAEAYLSGGARKSNEASPLFFESFAGSPPMLVHAGSHETLVDQIRAFVERARSRGATITYVEYADMVHVWHLLRRMTPEGGKAIDEIGAFLRAHT